jgi:hypothetical protein
VVLGRRFGMAPHGSDDAIDNRVLVRCANLDVVASYAGNWVTAS